MTSLTGVAGTMRCSHAGDDACAKRGPGHAIHAIQTQAAAATPSKWVDGIVRSVTPDGWIGIDPIGARDTIWAWHHEDLTASLSAGAPVALHPIYKVLAAGGTRFSVITL
jgi:hypothetical protein